MPSAFTPLEACFDREPGVKTYSHSPENKYESALADHRYNSWPLRRSSTTYNQRFGRADAGG